MPKPDSTSDFLPKLQEKVEQKTPDKRPLQEMEHEVRAQEIELQMQNEALIESQAKLITSLKRYEELFERAPTGYFILDKILPGA